MALKFMKMMVGKTEKRPVTDIPVQEKSLWELGYDLWRAGHDWSEPSNYIKTDKGIISVLLGELRRRDEEWLEFMEWQKDKELWRRLQREFFEREIG